MGRKTWESLPVKPLPKRENIILSGTSVSDVKCFHSIEQCIEYLNDNNIVKVFVIGGAQVYRHFIHRADELHITFVEETTEGIDTYFPVTLGTIMNEYEKIEEKPLTASATYSRWVRK
jgi:dihydrofolate reductase